VHYRKRAIAWWFLIGDRSYCLLLLVAEAWLILRWKGDFSPEWRFATPEWERLSFIKQMYLSKTLGPFINFMFAQIQRHWMFLFSMFQSIGPELGGGIPRLELLPGKWWGSGHSTNYISHGRANMDSTQQTVPGYVLHLIPLSTVYCNIQQWPVCESSNCNYELWLNSTSK